MGVLDDLKLADPASVRGQRRPAARPGGGLSRLVDHIEQVQDPVSREIIRSVIASKTGFRIPSRAEIDEEDQLRALRSKQRALEDATANVELAEVNYVDASPDLKKKYGLDPNDLWANGTDKALAFINGHKLSPAPLTRGQVGLALSQRFNVTPGDPDQILMGQEAKAAGAQEKARSEAVTKAGAVASTLDEQTKRVQEAAEGKGYLGDILTKVDAAIPENDWDESEPSRQVLSDMTDALQRTDPTLRPYLAQAWLAKHASFLKDQLEDVPVDQSGNLVVGAPGKNILGMHEEITGPAAGNLSILMQILGEQQGGDAGTAFSQIGLPNVKGIDPVSFKAFVAGLGGK